MAPVAPSLSPSIPTPAGRHAAFRVWDRLTGAGFTNLLHVGLPDGRDPADLSEPATIMRLRRAIMVARPLALGVADQRIADAAGGRDLDFQKRYAVLQHVLDHDLHRIPTDRISPYLAHLTQRLRLDHQTVTAAAVDRLVPNLTSTGRPEHIVEYCCSTR